jgi:RNA polymerase sigma-70 factor, ECF subfamily
MCIASVLLDGVFFFVEEKMSSLESSMGLREQDIKTLLATDLNTHFPTFVHAYERRLFAYVWCLLHHWQDAEDVVQQTIVNTYRAFSHFSWIQFEELALEPWLFKIARNLSWNHRSRIGARQSQLLSMEQLQTCEQGDDTTNGSYPSPEVAVEWQESCDELRTCIGLLPELYREPLILHYIADLSYPQVAQVLNQPLNTIKSNGYRGFKQLQQLIQAKNVKEEVK